MRFEWAEKGIGKGKNYRWNVIFSDEKRFNLNGLMVPLTTRQTRAYQSVFFNPSKRGWAHHGLGRYFCLWLYENRFHWQNDEWRGKCGYVRRYVHTFYTRNVWRNRWLSLISTIQRLDLQRQVTKEWISDSEINTLPRKPTSPDLKYIEKMW